MKIDSNITQTASLFKKTLQQVTFKIVLKKVTVTNIEKSEKNKHCENFWGVVYKLYY